MVSFAEARDALHRRLAAVFDERALFDLYPEAKAPRVYLGFPTDEPPFYVAVDEIVDAAETSGGSSMGYAEVVFDLHVWLHARHAELATASATLLAYVGNVFAAVVADPQLDMTVDNCFPSVEAAGTAPDSSKRYIAAASITIRCSTHVRCPDRIREIVHESNRNS